MKSSVRSIASAVFSVRSDRMSSLSYGLFIFRATPSSEVKSRASGGATFILYGLVWKNLTFFF